MITFVIHQLLRSYKTVVQRKHVGQQMSSDPWGVTFAWTYVEQGQALFGSQVAELITEHKLDG